MVLHTIFDDSLSVSWSSFADEANVSESPEDPAPGFCRRSLRVDFGGQNARLALIARAAAAGLDERGLGARLTLLARAPKPGRLANLLAGRESTCPAGDEAVTGLCTLCIVLIGAGSAVTESPNRETRRPADNRTAEERRAANRAARRKARGESALSSSARGRTAADSPSVRVHACSVQRVPAGAWTRITVPLASVAPSILASGLSAVEFWSSEATTLLVDDLQLVSARSPSLVRSAFYTGLPPADAEPVHIPDGRAHGRGSCEYMSAERAGGPALPRCAMDGDHLRGRWVRNCDPSRITRPDIYAYGRPLPRVRGKFDFRVCYRLSLWERQRAQQALSWTWRPDSCRMERFDGAAFDRWLGTRSLVLIGDSLTAQLFYSLVFLLGASVVRQVEHSDGMRASDPDATEGEASPCSSNVAVEGSSQFSEARLSRGGAVVKVLGHVRYIQELQNATEAPWARFVRSADFVLINVGQHYRAVDATYASYGDMVRRVERSLASAMKPSSKLLVRTTNLGHRECENATRPLRDTLEAWLRLAERPEAPFEWTPPTAGEQGGVQRGNPLDTRSSRRDPFDWRAPALHEAEWSRVFAASEVFRRRFALVNLSFLDHRADGHVAHAMRHSDESKHKAAWGGGLDCLHYCFPGPMDFAVQATFNQLLAVDGS